jgi:5'-methylthioadenosine phosphorylase
MSLAFIAGTSLIGSDFFGRARRRTIRVGNRHVEILADGNRLFLPRHGLKGQVPPHKLDHAAHMRALKALGADAVLAICSVGSLQRRITPAHYVVPDDYMGLWTPATAFDRGAHHITPSLDETLRRVLIRAARKLRLPLVNRGVYVQTVGPRLETRAEIRFLSRFADVVGMTMASEATVARELDLPYAALCVVDNFANGLVKQPLTLKQIMESAARKWPVLIRLLELAARELA